MKKILKRYRAFLLLVLANVVLCFVVPDLGLKAFATTGENLVEMLTFIPAIFILLGLLDVWVGKETMMKYMGKGAGVRGSVLAFAMGALAAGPLYAAFPVACVLVKKGVSLFNVFLFVGAWSVAKVPLLLMEVASLGASYMVLRFVCNLFGIVLIAYLLDKTTTEQEREEINTLVEKM